MTTRVSLVGRAFAHARFGALISANRQPLVTHLYAMSYEPSRSKAYDSDLRWRIVYQRFALEYSVQKVSENLGVSQSTVRRIGSLFVSTDGVDPKVDPDKGQALKALSSYDEFYIMELVLEKPGIYLREICHELFQLTGAVASEATVCRFLKKGRLHSH